MTNLFILNTIIEKDADYSSAIRDLTGGFVASDIERKFYNRQTEEYEIERYPHPHADLDAPDFSGKIIFIHLSENINDVSGADNIKSSKFKFTTAWNEGVAYAKTKGATHVAILNNVQELNPHAIALALEGNEEKEIVSIADGIAFIVKSDFSVDEKYNFWFVENDIFSEAEQRGGYVVAGVAAPHFSQAELTSSKEKFDAAVQQDTDIAEAN
jgi:hypothetical protein